MGQHGRQGLQPWGLSPQAPTLSRLCEGRRGPAQAVCTGSVLTGSRTKPNCSSKVLSEGQSAPWRRLNSSGGFVFEEWGPPLHLTRRRQVLQGPSCTRMNDAASARLANEPLGRCVGGNLL